MGAEFKKSETVSMARCEERLQQSRDEMTAEQSSGPRRVLQKGILIETGIRQFINYPGELIGDSMLNRRVEELVQQTRDEFAEHLILDAKYARSKGILMQKGILRSLDKTGDYHTKGAEAYVLQMCEHVNSAHLKEVLKEKGMLESWVKERQALQPKPANPPNMSQIIKDINRFTSQMETDHQCINWQEFRGNLLKVHDYYVNNRQDQSSNNDNHPTALETEDLDQVDQDYETIMEPLSTLVKHSKRLTNDIEGMERKISRLDDKLEEFYSRYNQTLIDREKAFKDMMALQSMRERIGRRLTHMELEIHATRSQISQQGVLYK
ncbi:hypothetical protein KR222_006887 [Zaprionus bogoriensis]|nr:hypothetical protein KR222_006887 [Zaprionus bogoriensis]